MNGNNSRPFRAGRLGRERLAPYAALLSLWMLTAAPTAAQQIDAGASQILRPQQGAASAILTSDRVILMTLRLPVSPEVAYDAWATANDVLDWLTPDEVQMRVLVGEGFDLIWDDYGTWHGNYLEIDRPQRLVFTWLPPEQSSAEGSYETRVELTFEELDTGGTLMRLLHSGFRDAMEMEAQLQAWRPHLFALRAYLLQSRDDSR